MAGLLAQRIALSLLTLFVVSLLVFGGTEILPGDVATAVLGQSATPEAVAAIRDALHLNDPAYIRYGRWLWGFVQGDLGVSLASGQPIVAQITPRLINTIWLAGIAALVSVPLAIGLGLLAAMYENSLFDRSVRIGALIAISVPEFFLGYILIRFFAVELGWFPSLSIVLPGMPVSARLYSIVLPVMVLIAVVVAQMLRLTRATLLEALDSSYVEMAVLKGLPWWRIVVQHAFVNVIGPVANIVSLNLAYLVVGIVVIEVVFVYPGLGQLMVDAVSQRDVPVVQVCAVLFAATYIFFNMLADFISVFANPRQRYPK